MKNTKTILTKMLLVALIAVFATTIVAWEDVAGTASRVNASAGTMVGTSEYMPDLGTRDDSVRRYRDDSVRSFSRATIDDYFTDNKVLLSFNRETSLRFDSLTPSDFPELRVRYVSDVNQNATRMVQEQIATETMGMTSVNNIIDSVNAGIVDSEMYRRVVALTLYENCKQGVLDAIRKLERREEIISASPDYKFFLRQTPNDPGFNNPSFNGNTNGRAQWGLNGAHGINAPGAWA
jgi:hypothetical protein